jgi:hypothetical protein
MTEWIGIVLDVILILVVGAGVVQAIRLIAQLRDLRASRAEMDRFVRDFNAAVMRAEAGIKGLRAAARESGDDLEKLVEKAVMVRDELNFIVESADGVAERLSVAASGVLHAERATQPKMQDEKPAPVPQPVPVARAEVPPAHAPASRAEKELMQALKKLS